MTQATSLFALRSVALSLLVTGCVGCQSGVAQLGELKPPTLDELPPSTLDPNLGVSGTKPPGLVVWLHRLGELDARRVGEPDDLTTWSTSFTLHDGDNTFVVYTSDPGETLFSSTVSATVTLLAAPITPPTLDDPVTPTNVTPQEITGTKGADTSVWIEIGGAAAVQVEPEGSSTTWSYTLPLQEGPNPFALFARSSAIEGQSARVEGLILLDTIAPDPPVLTTVPPAVGPDTLVTAAGTKDADGDVCVRINDAPYCQQWPGTAPDGTTTDFVTSDIPLVPGANQVCFSSADEVGNLSEEVCIDVLVVNGPSITFVKPEHGSKASGPPVDVEVLVTGDGSPGSNITSVEVCYDADGSGDFTAGECQPMSAGPGNRFTASVNGPFQLGNTYTFVVRATNQGGIITERSVTFTLGDIDILTDGIAPGDSLAPAAVWDQQGRLHVVWQDGCSQFATCTQAPNSLPDDIFHRMYNPSTQQWTPVLLISEDGGNDGASETPAIAVDAAGTIHVVWVESGNVAGDTNNAPDIAHRTIDANNISPSGLSAITLVEPSAALASAPALAADPADGVHLVWVVGSGNASIAYAHWSGGVWSAAQQLDNSGAGDSRAPAIAVDSAGVAHVVWQDDEDITVGTTAAGPDVDIFYRTISAGVLGPLALVSNSGLDGVAGGDSRSPAIAVGPDDHIHVVWSDDIQQAGEGPDFDIWYRSTADDTNGGDDDPFGPYVAVSSGSTSSSDLPQITVSDAGRVIVVWSEQVSTNPINADLRLRTRGAGSIAFGTIESVVSNPGLSLESTLAVRNRTLHVTWVDRTTLGNDPDRMVGDPPTAEADFDIFHRTLELPE